MDISPALRERLQRLGVAFLLFWLPVIVFMKIAGEVIEREPLGVDTWILNLIHSYASPFLDNFFVIITDFGGVVGVIGLTSLAALILFAKRRIWALFLLLASVGGAAAANVVLKLLFQRDRPSMWHQFVIETGFSFPSGHAMATAALAAAVIVICRKTRYRWYAAAVGTLYVVLIGLSRMYLGVHYPSDIVAGWSVSIAWVAIVTYFLSKRASKYPPEDILKHLKKRS